MQDQGSDPPVFGGVNQGMMDAPLFQSGGGGGGKRGGRGRRNRRGGRNQGGGGGGGGGEGGDEPPAPGTDIGNDNKGGKQQSPRGGGGGKRKFQFYCALCNAKTTGEDNFKVHLQGTRHLTNLKNKESGDPLILEKIQYPNLKKRKGPGDMPKPEAVRDKIASCEEPLIGIEYLLEFLKEDDPDDVYYVCEMCKCRLSPGSVMPHLMGSRHGVAYVKKHFPDVAKKLDRVTGKEEGGWKRSNITSELKNISREIKRQQGRQEMKTTMLPGSKLLPDQEKKWAEAQEKREKKIGFAKKALERANRPRGGGRGGGRGGRDRWQRLQRQRPSSRCTRTHGYGIWW